MPRRTHEDSLETKRSILESAQRLFSRRGYERTSLSDIAKYAGVTRGAIYWHFENKEELLVGLIDYIETEQLGVNKLIQACDPNEPNPLGILKESIASMVQEDIDKFINSTMMSMIISIMNGISGNTEVREKLIEFVNGRNETLAKAIKNCISKGQLPSNISVKAAVEHITTFCVGYIHQARLGYTSAISKKFDIIIDMEFDNIKQLTVDKI